MTRLQQFRLLCRALAPDIGPGATPRTGQLASQLADVSNWPALVRMAGEGLVTPALAGALQRCRLFHFLPEDAQTYLSGMQTLNSERNAILGEELRRVIGWLNEIEIEPVLLKGAINLVTEQYPGCRDRVIGDLDLLLPADRLEEAMRHIQRDEYRVAEGYSEGHMENHHHAPPVLHNSRPVSVELHQELCRESLRKLLPIDEFLASSPQREWQGARLRLPAATDRVMHTFVHAQLQDRGHANRHLALRPLLEFVWQHQAMQDAIDWQDLGGRLHQAAGVKAHAAFQAWLQAASDLFAQPPPKPFTLGRTDGWRYQQSLLAMTSTPVNRIFRWKIRLMHAGGRFFQMTIARKASS